MKLFFFLMMMSFAAAGQGPAGAVDSLAPATPLITDIPSRHTTSLNGKWQYIIDPYETGFFDYRYREKAVNDREAYWNTDIPANRTERIEHGFTDKHTLMVPGDWNHQDRQFLYYEGTVWYRRSFDYQKKDASHRVFIYFGAVNYRADVYLNGRKLGVHTGGFTPFNFEIPDSLLKPRANRLVVHVDNRRHSDEVPTVNTDWWNYGGITREVRLVELPVMHIRDFFLQLKRKDSGGLNAAEGWIELEGPGSVPQEAVLEIPELHLRQRYTLTDRKTVLQLDLPGVQRWSPESPRLYRVILTAGNDRIEEKIGFRTVVAEGKRVLLNGKPLFMRGICLHAEIAQEGRRAWSAADARQLLGYAKELGCNMVRLAHYPHDESTTRMADSMGILLWSEIPVYWTIEFGNPAVFAKAQRQLEEMIGRDRNRCSIIIWSVGNETPVNPVRTDFMRRLIGRAKELDDSRMISAALEVNYGSGKEQHLVDDPLGQYVDLVAFNQYLGWYGGLPSACRTAHWGTIYDKPTFISETGAEALGGFHGDSLTRWSEEYQAWYYREQVDMLGRMPEGFSGLSPWILVDFRSPKRNNPVYQDGWNNKGLIDHHGRKKKAFFVLQQYYRKMKRAWG